ncbi:hypothetical protein ACFD7P_001358 [Vibrio vulnificus]
MYRKTGRGRRREKAAGNVVEKNTLTTKQDENKERLAVIALCSRSLHKSQPDIRQ